MCPDKRALRAQIKKQRAALCEQEVAIASAKVCARIQALPEFLAARHVMLYLPIPGSGEIDLRALLAASGKIFYAPRVVNARKMEAAPLTSDLAGGAFGILEPTAPASDPKILDLILVPALCVDKTGSRIGFGRGYYDRFLASTRAAAFAAVHDFQVFDHIPCEAHDMPLGGIVSPGALYLCERT